MSSNQKKIEKFIRNAMQEANIIPNKGNAQKMARITRREKEMSSYPSSLDEAEIKILEIMESNANIDHFIGVLKQLEEEKSSGEMKYNTQSDVKKIEQICYAEIGRRMIQVQQKNIVRDFGKSNIHIRGYIMRAILNYIEELVKYSPNSIFILPNSEKAINFDAQSRPPEIAEYLEEIQYAEIIRTINYIIQKNIFKDKYSQPVKQYSHFMLIFLLALIVTFLLITISSQDSSTLIIVTGIIIAIGFILLIGFALNTFHQKQNYMPVTQSICRQIREYFNYLNGRTPNHLEWTIGEAFYWIEIKVGNRGSSFRNQIKMGQKRKKTSINTLPSNQQI